MFILDHEGARTEACDLPNDPKGHKKLVRLITKRDFQARVVLEATGNYSLDLALALHRASRVDVRVANPRAVSQFAGAYLRRSKTDALDARVLVEFTQRMPFDAWKPPEVYACDLRAISRWIEALTKTSTQEKNRLHAALSFEQMSAVVRNDIEVNIFHLERRIELLREQARELIAKHLDLERAFQHLTSVKGIATAAGIQLLPKLAVHPSDIEVWQSVAHAGIDPRQIQSGTSVHRPARISRPGNAHLRRALFLPALVAAQHEPRVNAFYEKLLARR